MPSKPIQNIFQLMAMAGLPDARVDLDFREYLKKELERLDSGEISVPDQVPTESAEATARRLRSCSRALTKSYSSAEKTVASLALTNAYKEGIDVGAILQMTSEAVGNLTELPRK